MSRFAPHQSSSNNPRATGSTICQKCLGQGHFTYQCKNTRPYVSRPSRTKQLENPKVLAKLKADGRPSVEVPEEFKNKSGIANRILEKNEKERSKTKDGEPASKRAKRSSKSPRGTDSESSSSDSDSASDSDSDSDSGSGSDSSSSAGSRPRARARSKDSSDSRDRRRRVPRGRDESPQRDLD